MEYSNDSSIDDVSRSKAKAAVLVYFADLRVGIGAKNPLLLYSRTQATVLLRFLVYLYSDGIYIQVSRYSSTLV